MSRLNNGVYNLCKYCTWKVIFLYVKLLYIFTRLNFAWANSLWILSDSRKGLGWSDCSKINVITRVCQPLGLNIKYEDKQLESSFYSQHKMCQPKLSVDSIIYTFCLKWLNWFEKSKLWKKGTLTYDDPYDEYNDFDKVGKKVFRIGKYLN